MADGDEYAVHRPLGEGAGFDVAQDGSLDFEWVLLARHFLQHRIPEHGNLWILEQPILQDLLRAETVAPVRDRHAGSEIGEEQRLLDRGIAPADHQHLLAAIEEAVAGGAGGNAVALEFLLGRQLQPTRLSAGRDDHAVCEVVVAGLAVEPERPLREIDLAHVVADELGPDMLGLLLHLLHQPGALDDVGEAGIVLDIGGDGELAAGLDALNQDRLQHGAGGIDRSRIARRPGTDDDQLGAVDLAHREQTPSCSFEAERVQQRRKPVFAPQSRLRRWRKLDCGARSNGARSGRPPTVPAGLKARCAMAAAGSDAHRCSAQFRSSWELCKICRPECHNVVKEPVRKVGNYRFAQ